MTSPYLTEAGWKAQLAKPKNLGLRAQGTGVSDKLRKYAAVNTPYLKAKTVVDADKVLKALKDLKTLADSESKSHKAFTEATKYLAEVVKEANSRASELNDEKERMEALTDAKKGVKAALKVLPTVKKAADFRKKGNGTLHGAVMEVMKAGKFGREGIDMNAVAKLNNRCFVDLDKVTDGEVNARKAEVLKLLNQVGGELAKVKP